MQPDITLRRSDLERLQRLLSDVDEHTPVLLIERLETELLRARVVDDASSGHDLVTLGSRVEFESRGTGKRRVVTLVLPEDVEGPETLSVLTPIGCSLLGLRVGDVFTWHDGVRRWQIEVLTVEQP
jgi:regulator of nucleoside diphosphate kinase